MILALLIRGCYDSVWFIPRDPAMSIFRFATLGVLVLSLPLAAESIAAPAGQVSVVLDVRQTADTYEGIGALSAGASSWLPIDYPEPQRGEILD